MKLTFIQEQFSTKVPEGISLLEALRLSGVFVDAPCGGQGTCGKCLVFVKGQNDWRQVRACQETVQEDLWVDTGKTSASHQILTESGGRHIPYDPLPLPDLLKDQEGPFYMVAVDIGTTTLAAYLLDRKTGKELCSTSSLNPQTAYGADVISRANFALEKGAGELSGCVREAIDSMTGILAEEAGISGESIVQIALVGNTCMHHLFFELPLESLVRSPYEPYEKELRKEKAVDFGIHIHPQGELIFLPVIAGFVGADTLGCLLAVRPDLTNDLTLLIDIGTNGELVLGNREKLVCCSTAAGPAFEGAKIERGMRGMAGAIDHVRCENKTFSFSVIGDSLPVGICGSGLIDAVASLRKAGLLDESGRLLKKEELLVQENATLADHLGYRDNQPVFLFDSDREDVYLSQKDIREVQLAKAAIAAGILLLEDHLGVTHADICHVYIAGAFGSYMDPDSACLIGLLPLPLRDRIQSIGNAAGEGAKIALRSREELKSAVLLSTQVESVELAGIPKFQDTFVDELEFPELPDDFM